MGFLDKFVELTRAYSLMITFSSCFIIFSFAYYCESFSFFNFFLLVFALCCVHMGANLFDDYIDVKKKLKTVSALSDVSFSSFSPKARLIINEEFSFKQVETILIVLFSLAVLIGIYFALLSGWQVLVYVFIGGLLTLFYPVSSKYYLSEIVIGLIYGPLIINGAYFALCSQFSSNLFFLSWAVFFASLVLLHTHNLMDWEFDIKEGKNTLCILSRSKENALNLLKILIIASYLVIFAGVLMLNFNPKIFYVFLTLPIAVKLIESMKDYINIKDVELKPRWYWGFFENWETIKENKIEFFMFRFYLARNYTFFFALFTAIGAMI